jgi:hypothetical protein
MESSLENCSTVIEGVMDRTLGPCNENVQILYHIIFAKSKYIKGKH